MAAAHPADVRDSRELATVLAEAGRGRAPGGRLVGGLVVRRPLGTWDVNLGGTLALLEALRAGAPRFAR